MFNKLTPEQIRAKLAFIDAYTAAHNAADGSLVDANANVTQKTVAVLEAELYKFETIQLNRAMVYKELRDRFGDDVADSYLDDLANHLIYTHDETSLKPYCASISLYPFLWDGTKSIGGVSQAPKNLQAFCGGFVNLLYQIASNFAGAVATVEFLMYFDYFARKTYGDGYLSHHFNEVKQELQGVVYAMNQPASARGDQSVFWNISVFDKNYFESLFGESFRFPDGAAPDWESLALLQYRFLDWLREEREREMLTFPVVTAAILLDPETKEPLDKGFANDLAALMARGSSFFIYQSTSADSLASCCRLRNELADNSFSYTLGAGGVSTGSKQVITLNLNRYVQRYDGQWDAVIKRLQKYLLAHDAIQRRNVAAGLLPAFDAGYISLDKQFLTIGINGAVEAAEYLGLTIPGVAYRGQMRKWLGSIKQLNKEAYELYGQRFNTEFVPAESLGVKNAKWDKEDGLVVPRSCYNSYFYPVEDGSISIIDKMELHGETIAQYLDGGAALHLNLEQLPTREAAYHLICIAARHGVPYWTFNTLVTICDACGHIDPETLAACPKCGNRDKLDYGTRIIGYLKRISYFSNERRQEQARRYYHTKGSVIDA